MRVSARSVDDDFVDVVEIPEHPWFVACHVILNLNQSLWPRIHCLYLFTGSN